MRVDVKKFIFAGTAKIKDQFFKEAQNAGIIHFIKKPVPKSPPKDLDTLLQAIKIARAQGLLEQCALDEKPLPIAENIIHTKHRIDALQEEEHLLALEKERVQVYGDFSLEDLSTIAQKAKRHLRFLAVKSGTSVSEDLIYINSAHGLDYFLGFLKENALPEGFVSVKIERSMSQINLKLQTVRDELLSLEQGLKEFSKYNALLHRGVIDCLNKHHLQEAQSSTHPEIEGQLFIATGYVPAHKRQELDVLVSNMSLYHDEIALDLGENIPTFLENKGLSKMGEDLVHIYDTPSENDRDPSLFVLASFALFFSMIIGDAGYGLVLLLTSLWLKIYKFPNALGLKKRVINLMIILFSSCIVWGVLTTSFFGLTLSPDNPLTKFSLTNMLAAKKSAYLLQSTVSDKAVQGIMVEIALMIGVVHILVSLARYMDRNYASFGWFLFVIGAYFYVPEYLGESTMMHYLMGASHSFLKTAGLILMGSGMTLAVSAGIYANGLLGCLEVMTVIQIFADVLSYLRLYALGLAGGIVSQTVNGFADSAFFPLAIIILFVGHSINIALAIQGGVIHGLRLNFLEWYHYSFYGGGILFNPLRKIDQTGE